MFIRVDLIEMW